MRPKVWWNIVSTTATGDILDSVSSRVHYATTAAPASASVGVGGENTGRQQKRNARFICNLRSLAEPYPDGVARRFIMIRMR